MSASRSSSCEPLWPPFEPSSKVIAPPSPMSSAMTPERLARRAVAHRGGHDDEVVGEPLDLRAHLDVVDPVRDAAELVERHRPLQPLGDPRREAAARAALHLEQVVGPELRPASCRGAGTRARRARRCARACRARTLDDTGTPASTSATWGARSSEFTRVSTAISVVGDAVRDPALHDVDEPAGAAPRPGAAAPRARRRPCRPPGPGRISLATRRRCSRAASGRVDDLDRAAVVDLERVRRPRRGTARS